jgi:CHAT domain/SIR2-like domain
MDAATLDVSLHPWQDNYTIDLRFMMPGQDAEVRPRTRSALQIDPMRLRTLDDPNDYGRQLTEAFFHSPDVRDAFLTCFNQAQTTKGTDGNSLALRIRLYVSPNAADLSGVRWETLRHPNEDTRLALSQRVLFSRALNSNDYRSPRDISGRTPDVLLVIADPENIGTWRPNGRSLDRIDVAKERASARSGFGRAEVRELSRLETGPDGQVQHATLDRLVSELERGCDVLYLVCHGALIDNRPMIWLEDNGGTADRVDALELVARMRRINIPPPRLVVLASCQSAGTGTSLDEGAMAALGPQLFDAGVPAVLAMQGNVSQVASAVFMEKLFGELLDHGIVDLAVANARDHLAARNGPEKDEWWVPALFTRLTTGNLLTTSGTPAVAPDFPWPVLVARMKQGRCTIILGSGVLEGLLGRPTEIARYWAETFRFPLAPEDREDLAQVAQYLAVTQDEQFPADEWASYLNCRMRQKLGRLIAQLPDSETKRQYSALLSAVTTNADPYYKLDDLIVGAGLARQALDDSEPHRLLARLPCPVFITTNSDSLLERSLETMTVANGAQPKRKTPHIGVFGMRPSETTDAEPSNATPLVYHLFGHLRDPQSLVLTEDQYFKFLTDLDKRRLAIPAIVPDRLTSSSLVFLGFRLTDWDFRMLIRWINTLGGNENLRRFAHVAVQVDLTGNFLDPQSTRRYLERQTPLGHNPLHIYWGTVEMFLKQLTHQLS